MIDFILSIRPELLVSWSIGTILAIVALLNK